MADKVLGRNCRFLQAKPGAKREPSPASTAIGSALAAGRARGTRILNFHKNGSPLWNDLTIVPLRNAEGVITHHVSKSCASTVSRAAMYCTCPSHSYIRVFSRYLAPASAWVPHSQALQA